MEPAHLNGQDRGLCHQARLEALTSIASENGLNISGLTSTARLPLNRFKATEHALNPSAALLEDKGHVDATVSS